MFSRAMSSSGRLILPSELMSITLTKFSMSHGGRSAMSATLSAFANSNMSISPESSTSAQAKNCAVVVPLPQSHLVRVTRSSSKVTGNSSTSSLCKSAETSIIVEPPEDSSSDSPITRVVSIPTPRPNNALIVVVPSTKLYAEISLVLPALEDLTLPNSSVLTTLFAARMKPITTP